MTVMTTNVPPVAATWHPETVPPVVDTSEILGWGPRPMPGLEGGWVGAGQRGWLGGRPEAGARWPSRVTASLSATCTGMSLLDHTPPSSNQGRRVEKDTRTHSKFFCEPALGRLPPQQRLRIGATAGSKIGRHK